MWVLESSSIMSFGLQSTDENSLNPYCKQHIVFILRTPEIKIQ